MNIKTVREFKRYSLIGFFLYIIIYYILLLFLPEEIKGIISDIWSPFGVLLSLIIMGWSIKHFEKNVYRNIWILCFLGNLSFLLGDLIWLYYEVVKGLNVPYPFVPDFYYILTLLFYFVAAIIFFKVRRTFVSIRAIFDIIIVITITTTLQWEFVFNKLFTDNSVSNLYKFVSIFYPVTDLALLFVTIFMYLNYYLKDKNKFQSKLLIVAPLIWIFADQIDLVNSNLGLYVSGDLIGPLWIVGLLILSIASVYKVEFNLLMFKPEKYDNVKNNNVNRYIGMLSPYIGIVILLIISSQYIEWRPLLIGAYISALLIIIRQIFTLFNLKGVLNLLYKSNAELEDYKRKLEETNNQLVKANSDIERECRTDFLTKLYNRCFVEETLKALISKGNQREIDITIMFVDIDYFKKVNDVYGHEVGDIVLKEVALIMKNAVRSDDIVGRWGGEEFIIINNESFNTEVDLAKIAERVRQNVESHEFLVNDTRFSITISIGLTTWRKDSEDINSLIRRADEALYKAKNTGRNRVIIA